MNKDYDDTGEDSGRKRIKSDEDFAAEKEAQDKARDELDVLVSSSFPREFLEQNTLDHLHSFFGGVCVPSFARALSSDNGAWVR